jgi:hypothetical protein
MDDDCLVKITNTYDRVSKDLQRKTTNPRQSPPTLQAIKNPESVGVFYYRLS